MIDTYYLETYLTRAERSLDAGDISEAGKYIWRASEAVSDLECDDEHCEDEHGDLVDPGPASRYVERKLRRIALGVYDEDLDGDLKTVLEEIERILR